MQGPFKSDYVTIQKGNAFAIDDPVHIRENKCNLNARKTGRLEALSVHERCTYLFTYLGH